MGFGNKKLVKAITGAILGMGIFSTGVAAAAPVNHDLANFQLAEIVVNGERYIAGQYMRATNNIGILGQKDMMDAPVSVSTISEKAVDDFLSSTEGLAGILTMVPSVRRTSDAAVDCVNIRGFNDDGRGFAVNGIPGMQAMTRQSTNYIDSVDVIEGPAVGIVGSSSNGRANNGGTVNINSKKAYAEPVKNLNLKYHSKSAFEGNIDIGERFGKDNRFGVRVNAGHADGERAIKGWDLKQSDFYINLDQAAEDSKSNIMFGYTKTDSQGRPYGFKYSDKIAGDKVIAAPDGDSQFNPKWRRDKNTNLVLTVNHEQQLDENLKGFVNLGHFKQDWYHYVGFSKKIINDKGDFTADSDNYTLIEKRDYAQIGVKGEGETGIFNHEYVLGFDHQWHYYGFPHYSKAAGWGGQLENMLNESLTPGVQDTYGAWKGNIYNCDPDSWKNPGFTQADAHYTEKKLAKGWSLMDTITSDNGKLTLLAGLAGKTVETRKCYWDTENTVPGSFKSFHDVSPTYGVNYTFTPRFAAYANHAETFTEGTIVGNDYANKGEVLDPYKTKENEFGIKAKTGDVFHKLSYFDIKKATGTEVYQIEGKDYLRNSGKELRHKGVEYTLTGSLAEKLNFLGGFMYLDAKTADEKRADGLAKWSGNIGLEYEASDDFAALMRMNYVGDSYIYSEKYEVPGYFTMDLGCKYKTEMGGTPVKLDAMVYNVFDKNYWAPSGNTLFNGAPRTFMLSAQFEL